MSSPLTPPLDERLCFSLYGASMAVGRAYKPHLDALGITYPQYLVLAALWEDDGQSIGAIAERLMLEPSTVTPLVKRLAASGLVRRDRNPQDERQVLVHLTEDGWAMQPRTACLAETMLRTSGLTLDRLEALVREVRALRDAVASATGWTAGAREASSAG